jgi:TonB-linked SusC/RagA family outer membrane protein
MYKKYTKRTGMLNRYAPKLLLIMRLSTVILIATVMQVSANSFAQRLTLSEKNAPLAKIFKEISKQSGYDFFVTGSMLKITRPVTIQVNNADMKDVLRVIFRDQPIGYIIDDNSVSIMCTMIASSGEKTVNNINISSRVISVSGEPLAGTTVTVKGTSQATITDKDGRFTLKNVPENAVLVITFVGYKQREVNVNAIGEAIELTLEVSSLEETVVVGYGTQKRKDLTTAVSKVGNEEILQSQSFAVSNALAGRVPGLIVNQRSSRPGQDEASIYIRGISTVGNTSALIVVDGVANRDGISRIDPNDIESITVLKDASASIYGAQSGNGVILVTTKRGKIGKPIVSYSFNHGIVSPTRYLKMSDAATFVKGINDLDLQEGRAKTYTDQQVSDYENGVLPSTDWLKETYKSSFNQDRHNLTVRGGTEAVKYFLSMGIGSQGTILERDGKSKYNQYNFRSNIDADVTKNFSVGLDISGRRENRNFPGIGEGDIFSVSVLSSPILPATILGGYAAPGRGNNNPLAMLSSDSYDRTENNLINGTLKAKYKIPGVEGLSIDGFAAIDYYQSFQKVWQQPWIYYTDENGVATPHIRQNGPSLAVNTNRNQSVTLNGKVNYERSFDKHSISAFISVEQNQTKSDYLGASRVGFVSSAIDQLFAGSPLKDNQSNDGTATSGARLNYLGRISYAYANKYLAQFYVGINGSQIFPKDKRFGSFPGGSLGWVISEEDFMKDQNLISNLKLRASYGLLGNDRVGQYQYLNVYGFGGGYVFDGKDVSTLNPGVAANPNITWEKKRSTDIGLDVGLMNNSITFTVDYFKSRTSDILAQRNATIPNYTGLSLPNENIGIVDNEGFDGEVNYKGHAGKLSYNIGGNFTYVKNKIVFIDEVIPAVPYQARTGKPIGTQFLYKVIGIYKTQADLDKYPGLDGKRLGDLIYQDMSGDGKINGDDAFPLERNATPQIQYGINLGAKYEQFDFSAQFQGQARAVQYFTYLMDVSNNAPEYYVKNAWTPGNANASLPRLGRNKGGNDLFVRDVSFLRLKNVEIGYTLPRMILSKIGFEATRFFVNGYNLLTFDKLKKDGLGDPESVNQFGWQFPQTKILTFGVNASF